MSVQSKATLYTYFETEDTPTQQQFRDLIDTGFNAWQPDGNAYGEVKKIGSTDNYAVYFITNNANIGAMHGSGNFSFGGVVDNGENVFVDGNMKATDQVNAETLGVAALVAGDFTSVASGYYAFQVGNPGTTYMTRVTLRPSSNAINLDSNYWGKIEQTNTYTLFNGANYGLLSFGLGYSSHKQAFQIGSETGTGVVNASFGHAVHNGYVLDIVNLDRGFLVRKQINFGDGANRTAIEAMKVIDTYGTGSPEGVVTANIGSTYRRLDGGASTSFYIKESGTGNTGWVAK